MFLNETAMCEQCPPNSVAKYNALLCGMKKILIQICLGNLYERSALKVSLYGKLKLKFKKEVNNQII